MCISFFFFVHRAAQQAAGGSMKTVNLVFERESTTTNRVSNY